MLNNWYCTVYTYKYRGKHIYRYSTSVEHNVSIEKPPCILLLHVVFQTFSCRRSVLASCGITRTLSKSLLCCTYCRTPAHYHHTMYCSPSLQLLHRLTLLALHRLRPPLSPSPGCPCGKQHVSGPCIVRACMSPCV